MDVCFPGSTPPRSRGSPATAKAALASPTLLISDVQTLHDSGTKAAPKSGDSIVRTSGSADSALDRYRQAITSAQQARLQASLGPHGASQGSFVSVQSTAKTIASQHPQTASAGHAIVVFDAAHGHVLTRAAGAAQAFGGARPGRRGCRVGGRGRGCIGEWRRSRAGRTGDDGVWGAAERERHLSPRRVFWASREATPESTSSRTMTEGGINERRIRPAQLGTSILFNIWEPMGRL
jgi:hypothetical protein